MSKYITVETSPVNLNVSGQKLLRIYGTLLGKNLTRFDDRTKSQFMQDINFGTKVEGLVFSMFLESCSKKPHIDILKYSDNGIANDGSYIEHGVDTSGADFMVDIRYGDAEYFNVPLEVKWVPTFGKLTLKKADLKAYRDEGADILLMYTSKTLNLRKPKDLNFEKHKKRILEASPFIRWGIMGNEDVNKLLSEGKFSPIPYMGNKQGIIIQQEDFKHWFTEETLA